MTSGYPNPTRYPIFLSIPDPTRFSFRNHRVAGNPKHRVLPDISGKPGVSDTTRYSGYPKYPKIPDIPGNTRNTRKYPKEKKIPGNTRSYFSTLLPDPNPTRYPVFCPIPDPTRPDIEKPYPLGTEDNEITAMSNWIGNFGHTIVFFKNLGRFWLCWCLPNVWKLICAWWQSRRILIYMKTLCQQHSEASELALKYESCLFFLSPGCL